MENAGHCKVSKQRGYVWRVPQAVPLTRRASKHFSLSWKARSHTSVPSAIFGAEQEREIQVRRVYVKDFSPHQCLSLSHTQLSCLSLSLCFYPPLPIYSTNLAISLSPSPSLFRSLQLSLFIVSLEIFSNPYHPVLVTLSPSFNLFLISLSLHVDSYVWKLIPKPSPYAHSFLSSYAVLSASSEERTNGRVTHRYMWHSFNAVIVRFMLSFL